jgi:hypothetical protein
LLYPKIWVIISYAKITHDPLVIWKYDLKVLNAPWKLQNNWWSNPVLPLFTAKEKCQNKSAIKTILVWRNCDGINSFVWNQNCMNLYHYIIYEQWYNFLLEKLILEKFILERKHIMRLGNDSKKYFFDQINDYGKFCECNMSENKNKFKFIFVQLNLSYFWIK